LRGKKQILWSLATLLIFKSFLNLAQPNFDWAKAISGSGYIYPKSIVADKNGNIYSTGYFSGTVDFNPGLSIFNLSSSSVDVFILKLDSLGNFIWAKQFSGPMSKGGNSIAVDKFGSIYITGYFFGTVDFDPGPNLFNITSSGNYSADVFVCKLSPFGSLIWAKSMGGLNNEYGYSIGVGRTGEVYTTGQFESTSDFDPGSGIYNLSAIGYVDLYINKLDSMGNFVWAKAIGGKSFDYCFSLALDQNDNIYTTGYFADTVDFDPGTGVYNVISKNGQDDAFINKFDKNGNFLWVKSFSGPSNYDRGLRLCVDPNGYLLSTGMFSDTVDFDPGPSNYFLSARGNWYYISKLDLNGDFVWAKKLEAQIMNIAGDRNGNVFTTGSFEDTCDFDPGIGMFNLVSNQNPTQNSFVSQLDNNGDFVCAGQTLGYYSQAGISIIVSQNSNYVLGEFNGTADFDPTSGTFNLTSSSYGGLFISKWNNCSSVTGVNTATNSEELLLFPNPSHGHFTINLPFKSGEIAISIFNLYGNLVFSKVIQYNKNLDLDLQDFAKGMYLVEILTNEHRWIKKIILR
jgi:hypothetical protein